MTGVNIIKKLREESGIKSRAEFGRVYGIPVRTLENWESGINSPADYVVDLLARAVWNDLTGANVWFHVIYKNTPAGVFEPALITRSYLNALAMAEKLATDAAAAELRVYPDDLGDQIPGENKYDIVTF